MTAVTSQIGLQFLNCLEGLMFYCLKTREINADCVSIIIRLFQRHQKCLERLQVRFVFRLYIGCAQIQLNEIVFSPFEHRKLMQQQRNHCARKLTMAIRRLNSKQRNS